MPRALVPRLLPVAALFLCLSGVGAEAGHRAEDPVPAWQQRLAQIEARLQRIAAADVAARGQIAADLSGLREDVTKWLAEFPPAREDAQAWLGPAAVGSSVEDLAAEIGRLRSTLSRIDGALKGSGRDGAFYLGRVDVSVTARTTASATPEMTPAGASVLDAADLRSNDRAALAGALALAPGVTFTRIGSRNETTVYVRGYDMRQVPLFIDGIPIYTPYDGYADLDRFSTFDVSEVVVSKGFTSVLYGANALGGAINIVSRRPSGQLEGVAGASYGSGPSGNAYVNAGSRLTSWYVQGGASYRDTDTFPLAGGFVPARYQPAGDRLNAYKQDTRFNVKLGWTPNGTDEYTLSYVGQRSDKGNPPYAGSDPAVKVRYWQWPYWDKDSIYLVSNTRLGSSSYIRGRVFNDTYDNALYSYDDATYTTQVKASSFKSLYHDYTLGASVEWGATWGPQMIRAAAHVKRDAHEDHNVGEPVKQFDGRIVSLGVEDSITLGPKASLVAGIGGDWQSTTKALDYQKGQTIDLLTSCRETGEHCGDASGVNPQAGLFYAVPTGQLRFTVSRKTRMPSLKDRYSYKMGQAVPNPDLRAEHNLTVEGGYQGTAGAKTSFQASVFYSRIDDLIQRFYLQPNLFQLQNIGLARYAGVELDARTRLVKHLDLGANYTYLSRKNLSDPTTPLVDTPEHKGRVSVIGAITPYVQAVGNIDFEAGRRTQNEGGTYMDVPPIAVVNLKGVWTIRRRVDAELGVFNVFDTYYWTSDGYPEAGRIVLTTVRCRF
jgi:iron complex outermembrane recepter protein